MASIEPRLSNYEITKQQTAKLFLKYDQENMIKKFQLRHDTDYLYIKFLEHEYRIHRMSGKITWSNDNFATFTEAGYNEAMTIYDVLCYSKKDCHTAGEFVNMKSLSAIQGGSPALCKGMFQKTEQLFDHKNAALSRACERLNGCKAGRGDIAYQIPVFDFLPFLFQFWNSDEEFPASLQLFTDKNILQYMHYETVWYAASHLLTRLEEELSDHSS